MAGLITDYGAKAFIGQIFGLFTLPANYYVGLYTKGLENYVDGEIVADTEISAQYASSGYARIQTPRNSTYWTQTDANFVTNNQELAFGPALVDWDVPIRGYALLDAATGGNCYGVGEFTNPRRVNTGQYLVVERGSLSVSMTTYTEPIVV